MVGKRMDSRTFFVEAESFVPLVGNKAGLKVGSSAVSPQSSSSSSFSELKTSTSDEEDLFC